MYEYNELTKALLAEGYSTEDYPDYVEIDTSRLPGTDPLHNSGGGFVYKRSYIQELVYMTGCLNSKAPGRQKSLFSLSDCKNL